MSINTYFDLPISSDRKHTNIQFQYTDTLFTHTHTHTHTHTNMDVYTQTL